jgi:hypothetical protein
MKIAGFLFTLTLLISCSSNELPDGVLPLDQMAPLVEEITLLETHYQSKFGVPSQYKKALDQSVSRVLRKANCTLTDFEKSLKYYAAHPELQKQLNEKLLTNLSRKIR